MPIYIDAEELCEGMVSNDPVVIAAKCEPTADVEPVRHAHWIRKSHEWDFSPYFYIDFTCSNCDIREQDKAPYCRYCGAKMDEENEQ